MAVCAASSLNRMNKGRLNYSDGLLLWKNQ
jgi:hypothetical protein